MNRQKIKCCFSILSLAILLMIGSTFFAKPVLGRTGVGVGFVEGGSSSSTSSSSASTNTTDSSVPTSSTSTTEKKAKSSETSTIRIDPDSPKIGGGTTTNIPRSEGSNKSLPSTGEKSSNLWIIIGGLLLVCAYLFNRIYESLMVISQDKN